MTASVIAPQDPEAANRKIDNTKFDPVSHKKTLTLINYFILNTSQFLNSLANVSERKIHEIDENLDTLETIIAIFEDKLDSLPEELFEGGPEVPEGDGAALPMTETIAQPVKYLEIVDNALNAAGANPKIVAPTAPKPAAGGSAVPGQPTGNGQRNAIIPGPPPPEPPAWNGKLPPAPPLPTGGPPPSAPSGPPPAASGGGGAAVQDIPAPEAPPAEPVDPDEARLNELMEKPDYAKLVKLYKVLKVPIQSILNQQRALGIYSDDDILLFVSKGDIDKLKATGEYKGTKF